MNGALLSAAATALTVKGALAGPLGAAAQQPLHHLRDKLGANAGEALATSRALVNQAQIGVEAAIVGTAGGQIRMSDGHAVANPRRMTSATTRPSGQTDATIDALMRADRSDRRARMRNILRDAAVRHGLDPKLILALSYWESGWDQSRVSASGAVGLMQVEPYVAQAAGPALLGRPVDINNPYDNADVGAAIFREDLDNLGGPAMALAAYYQGPDSVRQNGLFPDTQRYVQGILALASSMTS